MNAPSPLEIKQIVDAVNAENYVEVERLARIMVDKYPNFGFGWKMLSGSLIIQEKDALSALQRVAELFPDDALAHGKVGTVLEGKGRLEEARIAFEKAISIRPDFIEAHYSLSALKTYVENDPDVEAIRSQSDKVDTLAIEKQINYWFTVGKMEEDLGQFEESFAAYQRGNQLQFQRQAVDGVDSDALQEKLVDAIISAFPKSIFENKTQAPDTGKTPIFIVGMPRSGTSLLEQILSSCPGVFGAGELTDLSKVIATHPSLLSMQSQHSINELNIQDARLLGEQYIERVWKYAPDATHIVDKNFANFFHVGLIHLILPNAKIIHAMRDPMDSCFSCYSRIFDHPRMRFTCDMDALGRYFIRYEKLMQHWQDVLPPDTMLNMRYEDMVADTESEARRLMAYLELPWNDRCLAFHQNKRIVATASAAQVRKPIYKTSVARWRRYEPYLSPLLNWVGDKRASYMNSRRHQL